MSYTVKQAGLISLCQIAINVAANRSRQRSEEGLMTDGKPEKGFDKDFIDLVENIVVNGFDSSEKGGLILVNVNSPAYRTLVGLDSKADGRAHFDSLREKMKAAFRSVTLGKKGLFVPSKDSPLAEGLKTRPINNESACHAFDKQGTPAKADPLFVPASGNRRDMALPWANAIRVALGLEPITEVFGEVREYVGAEALHRDIVRLNEDRKAGVKPTTMDEKVGAAVNGYLDLGILRDSYGGPKGMFPDLKAGQIQQLWEHVMTIIVLRQVRPALAQAWIEFVLDTSKPVLSQTQVTNLRKDYRMPLCHRDFNKENKESFLGEGRQLSLSALNDHLASNKNAKAVTDYVKQIEDLMSGEAKTKPRVKPMSRNDLDNKLAARVGKGTTLRSFIEGIMNDDSAKAVKALDELAALVAPVFRYNDDGTVGTTVLTQKVYKIQCREGIKPNKAIPGGRTKKRTKKTG